MINSNIFFQSTQISYTFSGSGPVVVWLHGFMEDKSIWQGQLETFDQSTTNICIDLLGHGATGSVMSKEAHTMELQAEAVLSVLNKLEINTFSIVGHSMGGYVGLCLLAMCPEKITHFVLLNSTSKSDTEEKKANRQRAINIVARQKNNYARLGVVNLFSNESRVLFADEIEVIVSISQKTTVQGITAALLGMKCRTSQKHVLRNYTGKKLLIAGENDLVLPLENSYKEATCTGAQFEQLKGGHMSYLESKNELNVILSNFFNN